MQKAVPRVSELLWQSAILLGSLIALLILAFVFYKGGKSLRAILLPIGTAVMALVASFRYTGLKDIRLARELDKNGMTTHGTVMHKLEARDHDRQLHCDIKYEYGDGYQAWQKVSPDVYESLRVGDTVPVRYLLRDPKYSRMEVQPHK